MENQDTESQCRWQHHWQRANKDWLSAAEEIKERIETGHIVEHERRIALWPTLPAQRALGGENNGHPQLRPLPLQYVPRLMETAIVFTNSFFRFVPCSGMI